MATISSNLPQSLTSKDSADTVKEFFNTYFTANISFPAAEIDAVVGFFRKRGFDEMSANATTIVLLQQAKIDNVNVFTLLDTLSGLTDIQISAVVGQVLNYNREKTSTLGYRQTDATDLLEKRNIIV